jgi:hypothetical protein
MLAELLFEKYILNVFLTSMAVRGKIIINANKLRHFTFLITKANF